MTDKEYRKEHEALEEEFAIARLESGRSIPSARP